MNPSPQQQPAAIGPAFDEVIAAQRRISQHVHRTPVMTSASLNAIAGAKLYFKCENLQRSGSFKMRGASNAVFSLSEEEAARGVLTHSSGNHAAALALAARRRGIRAWIVMPSDAPQIKRRGVITFGGEITLCEPTLEGRETAARQVMQRTGAVLIHPYDDDRIIAGQATAAVELIEDVPELDFILAPVSGGGLLSGIGIATRHLLPSAQVIGCEPAQADDAARSRWLRGGLSRPHQARPLQMACAPRFRRERWPSCSGPRMQSSWRRKTKSLLPCACCGKG